MCAFQQLNVVIRTKRRIEELEKDCKNEKNQIKKYYIWGAIDAYKESLKLRFIECVKKIEEVKQGGDEFKDECIEKGEFEIAYNNGYINALENVLKIKRSNFDHPIKLKILGLVEDEPLVQEYKTYFDRLKFKENNVRSFSYMLTTKVDEMNSLMEKLDEQDDELNIFIIILRSYTERKLISYILLHEQFTEDEKPVWARVKGIINKTYAVLEWDIFERINKLNVQDDRFYFIYHKELSPTRPYDILKQILINYSV